MNMHSIAVVPHPLLELRAFTTEFPSPLGQTPTPAACLALLSLDAPTRDLDSPDDRLEQACLAYQLLDAPLSLKNDNKVREAVRRLLRHGGFKPAGRSKPASEYLVRAVGDGALRTINAAVDVCNIVSLHSGLPVSVVDLAKAKSPFRIGIAPAGAAYIFNASGQTIELEGLLCLFDAEGPCGSAVKDAQRTKTDADTRRTLTVIWGTNELTGHAAKAEEWYRDLLKGLGAVTESARIERVAM
jgi:DNA/RNA-binding domain of Phe-tRNA-synthetase-like protein